MEYFEALETNKNYSVQTRLSNSKEYSDSDHTSKKFFTTLILATSIPMLFLELTPANNKISFEEN